MTSDMMGGGGSGNGNEIDVPLSSLAINGQQPQEGDTVDFKIEARVTRIDGDTAYVEPEKVNGQPVEQDESPSEEDSEPSFSPGGDYMG